MRPLCCNRKAFRKSILALRFRLGPPEHHNDAGALFGSESNAPPPPQSKRPGPDLRLIKKGCFGLRCARHCLLALVGRLFLKLDSLCDGSSQATHSHLVFSGKPRGLHLPTVPSFPPAHLMPVIQPATPSARCGEMSGGRSTCGIIPHPGTQSQRHHQGVTKVSLPCNGSCGVPRNLYTPRPNFARPRGIRHRASAEKLKNHSFFALSVFKSAESGLGETKVRRPAPRMDWARRDLTAVGGSTQCPNSPPLMPCEDAMPESLPARPTPPARPGRKTKTNNNILFKTCLNVFNMFLALCFNSVKICIYT